MKMRKLLKKLIVLTMVLSILAIPLKSYAGSSPTLSSTEESFGIEGSKNIDVNNKIKGSKYLWKTSNNKVATVDKKGVIKGVSSGNVTITCMIVTPDGKTYKLACDVTINSKTKVTVVNQQQLDKALADEDVQQIIIKTSKEKYFSIPEGDYTDKRLYLESPNANTVNLGSFKSVHAYISNQEQLENALKDERVTIITIVTNKEETFEIKGDYPAIRVIIDAPKATVIKNANLRKVDKNQVGEYKEEEYAKEPETTVIPTPIVEVPADNGGSDVPSTPSIPSTPSVPSTPSTPSTPSAPSAAERQVDYEAYLNGAMNLADFYAKYAYVSDGYSYILPDEDGLIYFEILDMYIYVDFINNKIYFYRHYDFENTLEEFRAELIAKIDSGKYLEDSSHDGCFVSLKSAEKSICTKNIIVSRTSFSQYLSIKNWTDENGKIFYGDPEVASTLDHINIKFMENNVDVTEEMVNVATGSAIALKLYMNNVESVYKVRINPSTVYLAPESGYYTVDYNADNTAIITFNYQFIQTYLKGREVAQVFGAIMANERDTDPASVTFNIKY